MATKGKQNITGKRGTGEGKYGTIQKWGLPIPFVRERHDHEITV